MIVLLENPIPAVFIGVMTGAILLGGIFKTGRGSLLWVLLGVIVVTLLLVIIERVVVTPREEIELVLTQIARDLEQGQIETILAHIATDAVNLRRKAEGILPQVVIDEVRVKRNLRIDPPSGGPALTAKFNATIVGSERRGAGDKRRAPYFFILDFVREGESWRVQRYERRDATEGMRPDR